MAKQLILACTLAMVLLPGIKPVLAEAGFFVPNRGQWHQEVLYKAQYAGCDVYLLRQSIKIVQYNNQTSHGHVHTEQPGAAALRQAVPQTDLHAVEIQFAGANESAVLSGALPGAVRYNYFLGGDPHDWASDLPAFAEVTYRDIYHNIDLRIYPADGFIKYDFILKPGARLADIQMAYDGADGVLLADNRLELLTQLGNIHEQIPHSYYFANSEKIDVQCRYVKEKSFVGFSLVGIGQDVVTDSLIIDPALIFSTYSGSFSDNWGFTATFDDQGNLYSGGIVKSIGYPVTNGAFQEDHSGYWDIGLLKYDSSGTRLQYATYIGGGMAETPQSIIVDHQGNLLVYGTTSSVDFPVTAGAYQSSFKGGTPLDSTANGNPVGGVAFFKGSDLFVAKLSNDGRQLLASTFVGGTENDGIMLQSEALVRNYGDQFRGEVIVDRDNNVLIASNTTSVDFPVHNAFQPVFGGGAHDGVVFKLTSALDQMVWSSYIGGSHTDAIYSIKVAKNNDVYVAGGTLSSDFPTSAGSIHPAYQGASDGILAHISASGDQVLQSTYLGTPAFEQAYFVEIDSSGQVYVLGQTTGSYPVTADVYSNAGSGIFIHKLGPALDSTYFSTVVGAEQALPSISPTAFLVNECENIFISGWGGSLNSPVGGYSNSFTYDMPVTDNAFRSVTDGNDFYLMVLLKDAKQLLYGSYFGEYGGFSGDHVDGGTSRFDKRGIVYHAVCASCRGSNGFPTTPGAWSADNNSGNCNNAAFKFDMAALLARFDTDTPEFDQPGIRQGCYPLDLVFLNQSVGGEAFEWDFGEGTITTQPDSVTVTYPLPGQYDVSLTATDINTCTRESIARGVITVFDYDFDIMPADSICQGDRITLQADGGVQYQWLPMGELVDANTSRPTASPDTTTTYTVAIADANQCTFIDSVTIYVVPAIQADFAVSKEYNCTDLPLVKLTNLSTNAGDFLWDLGDGRQTDEFQPEYVYQTEDTFLVTLTAREAFCSENKTQTVKAVKVFVPNVITPDNGDDLNQHFTIISDDPVALAVYNRQGKKVYEDEHYGNDWSAAEVSAGVYFYEITLPDEKSTCKGWLHVLR
jgi:PKD repeat protein